MGLRGLDKIILAPLIKSHLTKLLYCCFCLRSLVYCKGAKNYYFLFINRISTKPNNH